MKSIVKTIFLDNIKSKIIIIYFVMLALISCSALLLEDNGAKGALTMLNIILFVVPLMSLLYSTIYLYNAKEFIILLLSQPLKRDHIWHSLFGGVAGGLLIAFLLGAGMPMLLYLPAGTASVIIIMGIAITVIFTTLAFLTAIISSDKTRGIGASILLWLFFTIIYDAVLLYIIMIFSDYPIEKAITILLMLNPLDLARFQVILKMEISAMMGYSGAAFKAFLGETAGTIISLLLLLLWIVIPYFLSLKVFRKKDI